MRKRMKSQKYKIVFCTPAIYSAGGVERVVSSKASFFADTYDYDVTIIVTEGNGRVSFFPISPKVNVVNLGIDFEELWNTPFFSKVFLYLKKQYKYKLSLARVLADLNPDIIITTLRREINFINKVHDGSVKIGELHLSRSNYRGLNNFNTFFKKFFYKWWKRNVVRHFSNLDKFVVLTNDAAAEWPELNNVIIIPDPLTIKVDKNSSQDSKRIIAIGRYSYEKGYDMLLHIWSIVEKKLPEWQLDIYGMGDPTPYFKTVAELAIDIGRCHLNTSVSDVSNVYQNSSILVQPSRFESFGLVTIEAMSFGLPIVSFDCDNGPHSIITNGVDGYLVPMYNNEMFAMRIIELANDKNKRISMGNAGKVKSEEYQLHTVGLKWKKLFDDLMSNK